MTTTRPSRPATCPAASRAEGFPRPPARLVCVATALVLALGIGAWPLSPRPDPAAVPGTTAAAPTAPDAPDEREGMGAPQAPVLHAGAGTLAAATGAAPDPVPPSAVPGALRRAPDAAMASVADVPRRRTRAQRAFGRRNLEGG